MELSLNKRVGKGGKNLNLKKFHFGIELIKCSRGEANLKWRFGGQDCVTRSRGKATDQSQGSVRMWRHGNNKFGQSYEIRVENFLSSFLGRFCWKIFCTVTVAKYKMPFCYKHGKYDIWEKLYTVHAINDHIIRYLKLSHNYWHW